MGCNTGIPDDITDFQSHIFYRALSYSFKLSQWIILKVYLKIHFLLSRMYTVYQFHSANREYHWKYSNTKRTKSTFIYFRTMSFSPPLSIHQEVHSADKHIWWNKSRHLFWPCAITKFCSQYEHVSCWVPGSVILPHIEFTCEEPGYGWVHMQLSMTVLWMGGEAMWCPVHIWHILHTHVPLGPQETH